MPPAQSKPWTPSATQISYKPVGGLSAGSGVYLRLGVVGFITEDGIPVAICTPIEKNGEVSKAVATRDVYYVPASQLVMAPMVAAELKEDAELRRLLDGTDTLQAPAGGS